MNQLPNESKQVFELLPGAGKKNTKTYEKVEFSEVEPLFKKVQDRGMSERQACEAIGYKSDASAWRKEGKAPKQVLYGLLGLIHISGHIPKAHFNHVELSRLFAVLLGNEISPDQQRDLLTKIAQAMTSET